MQALMDRKQGIRDAAPFMVARHEQDRDSRRRETLERGKCRRRHPRGYTASVQQVAAVDDHIHGAGACGL
jgi:hypothetical protein